MGISSNQARFLALTSRQIDLEHRIQQICQRRLRLTSELENVATSYNNKISNRQLYSMNTANGGIDKLTTDQNVSHPIQLNANLDATGYTLLGNYINTSGQSHITKDVRWYCYDTTNHLGRLQLYDPIGGGTAYEFNPSDLGLPQTATEAEVTAAALRAGILTIGTNPDEFTQSATNVYTGLSAGVPQYANFELKDWRTLPQIADELYNGDDVEAENKYDKTVNEINAQDKKLQLEQTTIEVEYKAITSEKESVKKILDTNAQASFKYFS